MSRTKSIRATGLGLRESVFYEWYKRNKFKAVTLIMDRRAYNPGLAVVRVGHRGREHNRYCIGKWVVGVLRVFRRHKTDAERDSGSKRTGAGHSANACTLPAVGTREPPARYRNHVTKYCYSLPILFFSLHGHRWFTDGFKSISNRSSRDSGNLTYPL